MWLSQPDDTVTRGRAASLARSSDEPLCTRVAQEGAHHWKAGTTRP
jgi:hypothetical protein